MGRISLYNYFLDSTNLTDDSQLVELSLQCCLCTETFYFFHDFQMLQCLLATAEFSWRSGRGPGLGCKRLTCPHCRRKHRNSCLVRLYSVLGCVFVGGSTWPPPGPPQKLPWQSVAESTGLTPGGLWGRRNARYKTWAGHALGKDPPAALSLWPRPLAVSFFFFK